MPHDDLQSLSHQSRYEEGDSTSFSGLGKTPRHFYDLRDNSGFEYEQPRHYGSPKSQQNIDLKIKHSRGPEIEERPEEEAKATPMKGYYGDKEFGSSGKKNTNILPSDIVGDGMFNKKGAYQKDYQDNVMNTGEDDLVIKALVKSHPECFKDRHWPPFYSSLLKDSKDTNFPRWRYLEWRRLSF